MLCPTIQNLYQLSISHPTTLVSPADLVRLACMKCGSTEVCPAVTDKEYDARDRQSSARKRYDQE
jgi:hypothetical protein